LIDLLRAQAGRVKEIQMGIASLAFLPGFPRFLIRFAASTVANLDNRSEEARTTRRARNSSIFWQLFQG